MAEKISAVMKDYPEALARQGDREAFDRVLDKVPSVPPDPDGSMARQRRG